MSNKARGLWRALIPPLAFTAKVWLVLLLVNSSSGARLNLWRRLGFISLPPVAPMASLLSPSDLGLAFSTFTLAAVAIYAALILLVSSSNGHVVKPSMSPQPKLLANSFPRPRSSGTLTMKKAAKRRLPSPRT